MLILVKFGSCAPTNFLDENMTFLYYFQNFGHKKRSDKKVEYLIFILLFIGIFKTAGDIKYFNSFSKFQDFLY